MTVQYANEARALSERSSWDINKLLIVIDDAAREGKRFVYISPRPAKELLTELESRGFDTELEDEDTTIRW